MERRFVEKDMVIIVMGVSGSGKTHVGKLLAEALELPFYDADDFHPEANVAKMHRGEALTDADRAPWLSTLASHIQQWNQIQDSVLACSALKESYRMLLSHDYTAAVRFVYLYGTKESILSRMHERQHFFPPNLLDSQFRDLEEPQQAMWVSINQTPEAIVNEIVQKLNA